jgi:hypothetical protein
VNISVTNRGHNGSEDIYAEVYQATGNYTNCGAGYQSKLYQYVSLKSDETTVLTFTFTDVENHNHTGCYGVRYGFRQ